MRRYASSRFRFILLCGLLVAAAFVLLGGTQGFAQSTGGAAPPAGGTGAAAATSTGTTADQPEAKANMLSVLVSMMLHNIDFVFITIALLSVVGLTLIIQGFIKNRAAVFMPEATTNTIREMIQQKRFRELIEFTETDPSFISRALNPALKRAPSFTAMKEAMETAIGEQTAEQFRKIEYLNIIGNLGPLLGLLGTVLGMIEAFHAMMAAGGAAKPAQLAGGISVALVHTFLGLMLAVPCLACFGVLRTIVDRLTIRGALVAEELLLMIKPQETKAAMPAGAAPAPAFAGGPPRPGMPMPAAVPAAPMPPGGTPPAPAARRPGPLPPPQPATFG